MCKFLIQKKALTFYSQSLICHCNALVLLSFIILPYQTSALAEMLFLQIKLHDAAVWELEGGVVGVFDI